MALPLLGGLAAKLVAPMIGQIAGGLLNNVLKGAMGGAGGIGGGLLGPLGDVFSKIGGPMGQIFGGAQQMGQGIGQLLAPRGMFPSLPLGQMGIPLPGAFGPRHVHVNVNIQINVQNKLGQIMQPGSQLLKGLNDALGKMQGMMENLSKLMGQLGQQSPLQQAGNFLEQLQNMLKQLGVGGQQGGQGQAVGPESPAASAGGGGGAGSTGGVGEASGGGGGGGGRVEGGFGQGTLNKAFDAMDSIEKEMEGIDPSKPDGMKKMMMLQQKMQRVQQMISTINEMRKGFHDSMMGVIRNVR